MCVGGDTYSNHMICDDCNDCNECDDDNVYTGVSNYPTWGGGSDCTGYAKWGIYATHCPCRARRTQILKL